MADDARYRYKYDGVRWSSLADAKAAKAAGRTAQASAASAAAAAAEAAQKPKEEVRLRDAVLLGRAHVRRTLLRQLTSLCLSSMRGGMGHRGKATLPVHVLQHLLRSVLTLLLANAAPQMGALLDTMSTETGERTASAAAAAQAGRLAALETVIEDTEAELARMQRSKVADMVKMYQGARPAWQPRLFSCLNGLLSDWEGGGVVQLPHMARGASTMTCLVCIAEVMPSFCVVCRLPLVPTEVAWLNLPALEGTWHSNLACVVPCRPGGVQLSGRVAAHQRAQDARAQPAQAAGAAGGAAPHPHPRHPSPAARPGRPTRCCLN